MQHPENNTTLARHRLHPGRMLLIGFFTVAPLWVTWLVLGYQTPAATRSAGSEKVP